MDEQVLQKLVKTAENLRNNELQEGVHYKKTISYSFEGHKS